MSECNSSRRLSSSSSIEAADNTMDSERGTPSVLEETPGCSCCPSSAPVLSKDKETISRRKAVLFNLIGASSLSLSTLFMKISTIRGNEITLATSLIGILLGISGFIFSSRKGRTFTNRTFFTALASGIVFGGGFSFLYFLSFDYITMGDSTTVNFFCCFVCCLVLETVMLKAIPHLLTILAGFIGLVGIILICQPEGMLKLKVDAKYIFGVCLTSLSGIGGGLLYIYMKKSMTLPNSLLLAVYFPGALLLAIPGHVKTGFQVCPITLEDRLIGLMGCALYAVTAYICISGSQLSLPSVSFVLKLFSIVSSYILQFFFLPSEGLSTYSILGALSISASLVIQTLVLLRQKSTSDNS